MIALAYVDRAFVIRHFTVIVFMYLGLSMRGVGSFSQWSTSQIEPVCHAADVSVIRTVIIPLNISETLNSELILLLGG